MKRDEYNLLLKDKPGDVSRYCFYIKKENLKQRPPDSSEASQIRKNIKDESHVNSLTNLILNSDTTYNGNPINEVPMCVSPDVKLDFEAMSLEELQEAYNEMTFTLDDGTHRSYAVPAAGGSEYYVSISKYVNDPSGLARRMSALQSNDYEAEGKPQDETDDRKNLQQLVSENYFFNVHGVRPPTKDKAKVDEYLNACADIVKEMIPNMYRRRGRRFVRNGLRKGIKSSKANAFAKETNKDELFEAVRQSNPHGWDSSKHSYKEGVKDSVVCENGTVRKVALVTSKNAIRKDALPNAFSSKTTNPDVKVDLYAGLGNKTAITDEEIHSYRMECIREYEKYNGSNLLAGGKSIFDNLYFYPQIQRNNSPFRDPLGKKWVTVEDVKKLDKKLKS